MAIKIDVTPAISVAVIGGLGYVLGMVAKSDARITALAWAIAEAAIQIIKQISILDEFQLEAPLRAIFGGATCLYLNEQHYINKTMQAIFSMVGYILVPDIISRIVKKIHIA